MLKKLLSILLVIFCLASCAQKTEQSTAATQAKAYTLTNLIAKAELEKDKEVELKGIVNHVCKHAGKKCFLSNEEGNLSMQVMAKGEITAFDKDLIGSEIIVKGILKEGKRISKEDILAQEQAVNEEMKSTTQKKEGGSCCSNDEEEQSSSEHEHQCQSKLDNIKQMQAWMKKNNKDYYAIYYVEGLSYELAN